MGVPSKKGKGGGKGKGAKGKDAKRQGSTSHQARPGYAPACLPCCGRTSAC